MKKQLIATAVALTLSVTAYADTTGSHVVNLSIAPTPSTLTLDGDVITGTSTNINIDNFQSITASNPLIKHLMGTIGISASGYPSGYTGGCELSADSDNGWQLRTATGVTTNQLAYQIKTQDPLSIGLPSTHYLEYGYATNDTSVSAPLVMHPLVIPLATVGSVTTKSCSFNANLYLNIGLTERPNPAEFITLTDTIDFAVTII